MKFKKDYINYLLYKAVFCSAEDFKNDKQLQGIAGKIIDIDDAVKMTYLVGKTAGLEPLFKYLLYISDKIDKNQVSIFNLKDNFEYDLRNITKICKTISEYSAAKSAEETEKEHESEDILPGGDETEQAEEQLTTEPESEGMTLIENFDSLKSGDEVFELDSINESVEKTLPEELPEDESAGEPAGVKEVSEITENEITVSKEQETFDEKSAEEDISDTEVTYEKETESEEQKPEPEIEIEVKKPLSAENYQSTGEPVKEESVTNEAYITFETKFFEEVKILEKLLATVDREFKIQSDDRMTGRLLQSLTEIIEITSELSNLSRQLMFDLIADVFFTMNLYFTKAIGNPELLEGEKTKLFDSSLALVNSLIKGEDYLNYDTIIDKIEKLKSQLTGSGEQVYREEKEKPETRQEEEKQDESAAEYKPEPLPPETEIIRQADSDIETSVFKLKYLVKEFEKSFADTISIKGEYGRFEALDKINELNNSLRKIAKISSSVKLNDVLKLAEVTYVFLKYLKDYRIDLLDSEIRQIIKYIIFTFKMLLTNRKPDDFNVLVQHLNNPVKIFTDS